LERVAGLLGEAALKLGHILLADLPVIVGWRIAPLPGEILEQIEHLFSELRLRAWGGV